MATAHHRKTAQRFCLCVCGSPEQGFASPDVKDACSLSTLVHSASLPPCDETIWAPRATTQSASPRNALRRPLLGPTQLLQPPFVRDTPPCLVDSIPRLPASSALGPPPTSNKRGCHWTRPLTAHHQHLSLLTMNRPGRNDSQPPPSLRPMPRPTESSMCLRTRTFLFLDHRPCPLGSCRDGV